MTTNKMRVRELSGELGISNKELIHLLRKLEINVKSHMSGLTDEEAEKARREFHEASEGPAVENKRVRSGVIVRRRKKPARKPRQEPVEASGEEAVAGEADVEETSAATESTPIPPAPPAEDTEVPAPTPTATQP
jgi:translation initiation factor IF-2